MAYLVHWCRWPNVANKYVLEIYEELKRIIPKDQELKIKLEERIYEGELLKHCLSSNGSFSQLRCSNEVIPIGGVIS